MSEFKLCFFIACVLLKKWLVLFKHHGLKLWLTCMASKSSYSATSFVGKEKDTERKENVYNCHVSILKQMMRLEECSTIGFVINILSKETALVMSFVQRPIEVRLFNEPVSQNLKCFKNGSQALNLNKIWKCSNYMQSLVMLTKWFLITVNKIFYQTIIIKILSMHMSANGSINSFIYDHFYKDFPWM